MLFPVLHIHRWPLNCQIVIECDSNWIIWHHRRRCLAFCWPGYWKNGSNLGGKVLPAWFSFLSGLWWSSCLICDILQKSWILSLFTFYCATYLMVSIENIKVITNSFSDQFGQTRLSTWELLSIILNFCLQKIVLKNRLFFRNLALQICT